MNGSTVLKSQKPDGQAEVDRGALGARITELRNLKGWTQRGLRGKRSCRCGEKRKRPKNKRR